MDATSMPKPRPEPSDLAERALREGAIRDLDGHFAPMRAGSSRQGTRKRRPACETSNGRGETASVIAPGRSPKRAAKRACSTFTSAASGPSSMTARRTG